MKPGRIKWLRRSTTSAPVAPIAPFAPIPGLMSTIRSPSITRVPSGWTLPGRTRSAPDRTIMDGNISVMSVLGIDVGGTKTVCLLADETERVIAGGREEGANLQGAGELALEKVLHSVMEKTLEGTGVIPSAICLGIAGVDRASDEVVVRSIRNRIDCIWPQRSWRSVACGRLGVRAWRRRERVLDWPACITRCCSPCGRSWPPHKPHAAAARALRRR